MYDAFISHSSRDARRASAICELLEDKGLRCWIAPRDVKPGRDYALEILDGLEQSKSVVIALTNASNQSDFVKREAERAANWKKPIICVRLSNIMPSRSLELYLSTTQWIDAFGPTRDGARYGIVRAVRAAGGTPSRLSRGDERSFKPTSKSVRSVHSMLKWRFGQARRALNDYLDPRCFSRFLPVWRADFEALAILPLDTRLAFHGLKVERMAVDRGVIIGRAADEKTLQISDRTISRHHLLILNSTTGLKVTDLGSTNGTFVNNRKLKPHVASRFTVGDRMRIGAIEVAIYYS